jgi:catechol 2,3-dioxygenase-like lactoylglutathione lyase family enzyme
MDAPDSGADVGATIETLWSTALAISSRIVFWGKYREVEAMAIVLNHLIVWSKDQKEASRFLADLFGLPDPYRFSHFDVVNIGGVSFDFANSRGPVQRQHMAFLVSDEEFDAIFARIKDRNLPYWADPRRERPNEICPDDDGRGIYFSDPSDHNLEIITRPYTRALVTRNPEALASGDALP